MYYTLSKGPQGAPALVLVHGAGGSRLLWPPKLRRLPGVTVYTLDLPGHGRSGGQACDTVAGYAEAVVAFLDEVRIARAVIAGHSLGGAIALTLVLDFPDRVAGLVLVASGARLRVAPAILEGVHLDCEGVVELVSRSVWSPAADPALVERGRRALLEAGPAALLNDFTACDRFDVLERLGEIKVPTLVIAGSADVLTPLKYARFLAEHIPAARCEIVAGAGHMVMLERPAEVARVVRGFLEDARLLGRSLAAT
jgi:pimeloyl-ACP methyl ester carboxylesterase